MKRIILGILCLCLASASLSAAYLFDQPHRLFALKTGWDWSYTEVNGTQQKDQSIIIGLRTQSFLNSNADIGIGFGADASWMQYGTDPVTGATSQDVIRKNWSYSGEISFAYRYFFNPDSWWLFEIGPYVQYFAKDDYYQLIYGPRVDMGLCYSTGSDVCVIVGCDARLPLGIAAAQKTGSGYDSVDKTICGICLNPYLMVAFQI